MKSREEDRVGVRIAAPPHKPSLHLETGRPAGYHPSATVARAQRRLGLSSPKAVRDEALTSAGKGDLTGSPGILSETVHATAGVSQEHLVPPAQVACSRVAIGTETARR
jgi:hypothetical protein